jgi:hypothetical protein
MSKSNPPAHLDPMKAWRDWFVSNEREWSESLSSMMKDDTWARMLGREMNASIHGKQMFAKELAGSMAAMNVPTRDDIVALGERIGLLEDAVARVEALLVRVNAGNPAGQARPPRTRKPPRATKASR